ncbi:ankyrin repeat-containing domain protein [Mycena galopus ATCC 62051]|nr:ankyrin repeat-containing domain protein [Mycena galopus ATCC 62051]
MQSFPKDVPIIPATSADMLPEAFESLSITQHISGGIGGHGGDGYDQGHGGGGGRGEGNTFYYNVTAGQFSMNNQYVLQSLCINERKKIIDWLSPLNFFVRQDDIFSTHQEGTGEWLLQKAQFKGWESSVGGVLWCRGIPGVGKTVLASVVVNYLTTKYKPTSSIGVACIYLNHKETGIQTPHNLMSGLWSQLVHEKPLGSLVHNTHAEHTRKGTRPSMAKVRALLHNAIAQWSKVYIIDKQHILLKDVGSLGATVNLIVTSRPNITVTGRFSNLEVVDIKADPNDIHQYIEAHIQNSEWLSKQVRTLPELRDEFHSKITDAGDGMFLLVKLHLESLMVKHTVKGVREMLDNLPKDILQTYDNAIERINKQNEDHRRIAHLALIVQELREALAITQGSTHLEEDCLVDIENIISVCVEAHEEYLVEIAHALLTLLTLEQFGLEFLEQNRYRHYKGPGHALLIYAQYCFVHAAGEPEGPLREMILKFLRWAPAWKQFMGWKWYSVHPWNYSGWPGNTTPLWLAAAGNLLETAKYLMSKKQKLQNIGKAVDIASSHGHLEMVEYLTNNYCIWWKIIGSNKAPFCDGLKTASLEGHLEIVQVLIEKGANVNAQDKDGDTSLWVASANVLIEKGANVNAPGKYDNTPLHAASSNVLIEKGANVNAPGDYGDTPLWAASSNVLIKKGANVNAEGKYGDTPLRAACSNVLIEKGANVNAQGKYDDTPLHAASSKVLIENGKYDDTPLHAASSNVLIEKGANVNAQGKYGHTPLWAAFSNGHLDIVRVLIEKSANVNAKGNYGDTPLRAASSNGHLDIVRVLIEKGANVNAQSKYHDTPLQAASLKGHLDIVQVLIEKGANVNGQGKYEDTPLHAASSNGHLDIVQVLIEKGANVNGEGKYVDTPLWAASSNGHLDIIQILIEKGANVNAQSKYCDTPLQAASMNGHLDIVQVLIEKGANVNVQGKYDDTPMHAASSKGHLDIVQVLIEKGAKVNAESKYGDTPLRATSSNCHLDIVQVLIEKGANVNAEGKYCDTPLQAASLNGHLDIVQVLINKGANVNAPGQYVDTPLRAASSNGYLDIVQVLIEKGANVNAPGKFGETALQTALWKGWLDLVQFLRDKGAE